MKAFNTIFDLFLLACVVFFLVSLVSLFEENECHKENFSATKTTFQYTFFGGCVVQPNDVWKTSK